MVKLLGTNVKLSKNDRVPALADYLIAGLTLAPHNLSGHNVCAESTDGCRNGCVLWFAGQRVMPSVRAAALKRTEWLFTDRSGFMAQLRKELDLHIRRARKRDLKPLVRLNVASDLSWSDLIGEYSHCEFYDYTKVRSRFADYLDGKLPRNYALTFSASERTDAKLCRDYLRAGGNVAQVFAVDYYPAVKRIGDLPAAHKYAGARFPVFDGDIHDVCLPRFDGLGQIRGLRLKGTNASKAQSVESGFAVAPQRYPTLAAMGRPTLATTGGEQ